MAVQGQVTAVREDPKKEEQEAEVEEENRRNVQPSRAMIQRSWLSGDALALWFVAHVDLQLLLVLFSVARPTGKGKSMGNRKKRAAGRRKGGWVSMEGRYLLQERAPSQLEQERPANPNKDSWHRPTSD
jgi:hypothetical protein